MDLKENYSSELPKKIDLNLKNKVSVKVSEIYRKSLKWLNRNLEDTEINQHKKNSKYYDRTPQRD